MCDVTLKLWNSKWCSTSHNLSGIELDFPLYLTDFVHTMVFQFHSTIRGNILLISIFGKSVLASIFLRIHVNRKLRDKYLPCTSHLLVATATVCSNQFDHRRQRRRSSVADFAAVHLTHYYQRNEITLRSTFLLSEHVNSM